MRRRRKLFDLDELLSEALSCYDQSWWDRAAALPNDDDGTALAAVWLAWPGRLSFLTLLNDRVRDVAPKEHIS